jgi:hypothetical protein
LELDVSQDQDQAALVLKDMEIQDMPVLTAQLVKSELLLVLLTLLVDTPTPVSTHQPVQVLTKLDLPLTPLHAEDAKLANTQDLSQINSKLNVLPDLLLTAKTALPDNQLMDTAVNNAQLDQSKTQIT